MMSAWWFGDVLGLCQCYLGLVWVMCQWFLVMCPWCVGLVSVVLYCPNEKVSDFRLSRVKYSILLHYCWTDSRSSSHTFNSHFFLLQNPLKLWKPSTNFFPITSQRHHQNITTPHCEISPNHHGTEQRYHHKASSTDQNITTDKHHTPPRHHLNIFPFKWEGIFGNWVGSLSIFLLGPRGRRWSNTISKNQSHLAGCSK